MACWRQPADIGPRRITQPAQLLRFFSSYCFFSFFFFLHSITLRRCTTEANPAPREAERLVRGRVEPHSMLLQKICRWWGGESLLGLGGVLAGWQARPGAGACDRLAPAGPV